MNQILENSINYNVPSSKNVKKFKIIFWSFIFIAISSIILFLFLRYNSFKKEQISKRLVNNFEIRTLYSNSNEYTTNLSNLELSQEVASPFVIGLIQIEKINLLYPILSTVSDELLNIAPCRFYGPMPNQIGNICIAGHNNANDKLFGKLDMLNNGDIIKIYDLNGYIVDYYIYNIQTIQADDTSCMYQNTNNKRELSLITCNSIKNSRLLVKAVEK